MEYHTELPPHCPPTGAEQVERRLYKAIDGSDADEKDFKSFAERGRKGIDTSKCASWGLSVWPDMDAVEHALDAIPYFRKKCIIQFSVKPSDGCLMHTESNNQPNHHTFWKKNRISLLETCVTVKSPE